MPWSQPSGFIINILIGSETFHWKIKQGGAAGLWVNARKSWRIRIRATTCYLSGRALG